MTPPRPTSALAALARGFGLAPTERTDVHAYVAALEALADLRLEINRGLEASLHETAAALLACKERGRDA